MRTNAIVAALLLCQSTTASFGAPTVSDKTPCSDINHRVDEFIDPLATGGAIAKVFQDLDERRVGFGLPAIVPGMTPEAKDEAIYHTLAVCRIHPDWRLEDATGLTYGILAKKDNEKQAARKAKP